MWSKAQHFTIIALDGKKKRYNSLLTRIAPCGQHGGDQWRRPRAVPGRGVGRRPLPHATTGLWGVRIAWYQSTLRSRTLPGVASNGSYCHENRRHIYELKIPTCFV